MINEFKTMNVDDYLVKDLIIVMDDMFDKLCHLFDRDLIDEIIPHLSAPVLQCLLKSNLVRMREDMIWDLCIKFCCGSKYVFNWQCKTCKGCLWKDNITDDRTTCRWCLKNNKWDVNYEIVKDNFGSININECKAIKNLMKQILKKPYIRFENFGLNNFIINVQPVLLQFDLMKVEDIFRIHMLKHQNIHNIYGRITTSDLFFANGDSIGRRGYPLRDGSWFPTLVHIIEKSKGGLIVQLPTTEHKIIANGMGGVQVMKDNFIMVSNRNDQLVVGQQIKAKPLEYKNTNKWYDVSIVCIQGCFIKVKLDEKQIGLKTSWWIYDEDETSIKLC